MILMSQGAIEALEEQAFQQGRGYMFKQMKRLRELLEVEDDDSLMDAVERLGSEVRAHREVARVAAQRIEEQRNEIDDLQERLHAAFVNGGV